MAKPEQQTDVPQLAVSKRFGQYKKEEKKEERKADRSVESENFKRLVSLFQEIKIKPRAGWSNEQYDMRRFYSIYNWIRNSALELDYSAEDVAAFCSSINRFDKEAGPKLEISAYLSALIKAGRETEYLLPLNHTDGDFPYLGFENTKNITIVGDVDSIGNRMKDGLITVHGWGGHVGQDMRGGRIIIHGDCDGAGSQMRGGEIIVNGRIRKGHQTSGSYCGIGFGTSGGKIVVSGDCENVANVSQGDITVGGNVITAGMCNDGAVIRIGGSVSEELGRWMRDGEVHIGGDIPGIIRDFGGGKIFHKGRLIVDMPRFYGDGLKTVIEIPK